MFGVTRYQWFVLFAAWLGWGFDVFDGLLFNFVAPVCVPNLLGLDPVDPATKNEVVFYTALLTSLLLLGWALGGIFFGRLTDKLGRTRTLLLTMLTYSLSTAACAFAPNIETLALFRFVASLGIGGEWAAGAALVAETWPSEKRVLGGALLYTASPMGLFLATFVNDLFTRQLDVLASDPALSWRVVFLTGLIPAAVAVAIRFRVKEPEGFEVGARTKLSQLFAADLRRRTFSGLSMAVIALITWWSCSAFIPVVAAFLTTAADASRTPLELGKLRAEYIAIGTTAFNFGGLTGTLFTVPVATKLGRKAMFMLYFCSSSVTIYSTFGLDHEPLVRLQMLFLVGLSVYGIFGSFSFYLPELFPAHLRGTGAGFCYNAGRIFTSIFPFAVGWVVRSGYNPLMVVSSVAVVPAVGAILVLLGLVYETRDV
jgi:MFS family permease